MAAHERQAAAAKIICDLLISLNSPCQEVAVLACQEAEDVCLKYQQKMRAALEDKRPSKFILPVSIVRRAAVTKKAFSVRESLHHFIDKLYPSTTSSSRQDQTAAQHTDEVSSTPQGLNVESIATISSPSRQQPETEKSSDWTLGSTKASVHRPEDALALSTTGSQLETNISTVQSLPSDQTKSTESNAPPRRAVNRSASVDAVPTQALSLPAAVRLPARAGRNVSEMIKQFEVSTPSRCATTAQALQVTPGTTPTAAFTVNRFSSDTSSRPGSFILKVEAANTTPLAAVTAEVVEEMPSREVKQCDEDVTPIINPVETLEGLLTSAAASDLQEAAAVHDLQEAEQCSTSTTAPVAICTTSSASAEAAFPECDTGTASSADDVQEAFVPSEVAADDDLTLVSKPLERLDSFIAGTDQVSDSKEKQIPATAGECVEAPVLQASTEAKPKRSHRRSAVMCPLLLQPQTSQEQAPQVASDAVEEVPSVALPSEAAEGAASISPKECDEGQMIPHSPQLILSPGPTSPRKGLQSPKKGLEPWQLLRQLPLPPPQMEENYELSEQGDSDVDEAVETQRRAAKAVPRWCGNYLELLQKQSELDPDTVFGTKVPMCDLNDIFPDELYEKVNRARPNRARGSSGNWRKDALTRCEISAYKSKLGQTKTWMGDLQNLPAPPNPDVLAGLKSLGRPLPTPARAHALADTA
jgi:hypothetical protein